MELGGYDYPVRRLRRSGGASCVTLPLQVRNSLALERGDWLVFGETPWPGLAAFVKISAEQYERIAADGRKEFRQLARKVQGKESTLSVAVPSAIRKILLAEPGDHLIFGLTPQPGVLSISAIKGGDGSTGGRRSG